MKILILSPIREDTYTIKKFCILGISFADVLWGIVIDGDWSDS